ncbi:N-acetyl sugar amidotransferase [Pseudomonadales bacterium]|nr:N-acetyl sugar amidotransferase [Pseudomonadales bacterium]
MNYQNNKYSSILHKSPHQECIRCVMDTSDPLIVFDEVGVCNYCTSYDEYVSTLGSMEEREKKIESLTSLLRRSGEGKEYDCILGLSGGVDSSYLCWFVVKKLNLRPLVVHIDAGWNSELAVNNIHNLVRKLEVDLHTLVIDWTEISDIQKAYFRSGVANLDVAQDHAFLANLYKEASKFGISNILSGGNMQTESVLPTSWGYDASDGRSLLAIHKRFGDKKLKSYCTLSAWDSTLRYPIIKKMQTHRPLEWINYNKEDAKRLLISELGWRDYGGKHYESVFTKFFQAYYLPEKFGYDKRRAHLSSLVLSGQLSREDAVNELKEELYSSNELEVDKRFWMKKLGITQEEFDDVMKKRPMFYTDYPNNKALLKIVNKLINIAGRFKNWVLNF